MSRNLEHEYFEDQFKNGTKEEITQIVRQAGEEIIGFASKFYNLDYIIKTFTWIAKFGVAEKRELNAEEKTLVDTIFGQYWEYDREEIYSQIAQELTDDDYRWLETISENEVEKKVAFLKMVLGFAYIDGEVNAEILNDIADIFDFRNEFFPEDEMPEEPDESNCIYVTELEMDILNWYQTDDQLRRLDDIVAHFPKKSKSEVKEALDSLCEKGIMMGGEKIFGKLCMYGLME